MSEPQHALSVAGLQQSYGSKQVLRGIDFALERGAIGCLLGPSASGKTTLLRAIAGLEPIADGEIRIEGKLVSSASLRLPPEARRIGLVFQDYALFPHLTVADNIAFGLRGLSRAERGARLAELAARVGLEGTLARYPHQLSGGQQQRVALARALAPRPALVLLDEPFASLDSELREKLSLEVRDIIKDAGATALLVTHNQQEAFAIADEIGVLHEGRIEQWDSAYNLYHRPASRFVADFVGQGVLVPARVLNSHQVQIELGVLEGDVPHQCERGCDACGRDCRAEVLLRPDDVVHDDAAPTQAEVVHKAFRGAEILYTLRLQSGQQVLALVPSHHNHAIGERIGIRLDADHVVAFAPDR